MWVACAPCGCPCCAASGCCREALGAEGPVAQSEWLWVMPSSLAIANAAVSAPSDKRVGPYAQPHINHSLNLAVINVTLCLAIGRSSWSQAVPLAAGRAFRGTCRLWSRDSRLKAGVVGADTEEWWRSSSAAASTCAETHSASAPPPL